MLHVSIDANACRQLVWMNIDEELTDDCLVRECVTGFTLENIGHID